MTERITAASPAEALDAMRDMLDEDEQAISQLQRALLLIDEAYGPLVFEDPDAQALVDRVLKACGG